jgi:hypothetical protein
LGRISQKIAGGLKILKTKVLLKMARNRIYVLNAIMAVRALLATYHQLLRTLAAIVTIVVNVMHAMESM